MPTRTLKPAGGEWALLPWGVGENSGRVYRRATQTCGAIRKECPMGPERVAQGLKPKCVMRGRWDAGHPTGRKKESSGRKAGYGGDPGAIGEAAWSAGEPLAQLSARAAQPQTHSARWDTTRSRRAMRW